MNDLISRQAAIEALCRGEGCGNICRRAIERIEPAQRWIPVVRGKWNRTDAYPHRLYCSVCYKTYIKNDELLERWEFPLNFCPNCGADMREEP